MQGECCGLALCVCFIRLWTSRSQASPGEQKQCSLLHSPAGSRALGALFALRILPFKVEGVTVLDEAFPASGGPFPAQVTNQCPNTSGVRFPLPCLSSNTCLISLVSQVITSGELICYSTRAAIGLASTKTRENLSHR